MGGFQLQGQRLYRGVGFRPGGLLSLQGSLQVGEGLLKLLLVRARGCQPAVKLQHQFGRHAGPRARRLELSQQLRRWGGRVNAGRFGRLRILARMVFRQLR